MTVAWVTCGMCGTELRDIAKFCDTCGCRLATSMQAAEYKQVTVLFADVVRSMDIAAAVDMERLRDIMTELVERSAAVVVRYGGTVEYAGDGVMALFGAPIALEDHAFRGCLAALAIQEEANRLAAEVARRDGVALRLRVGLNSGRVIAGEIGSGSLGYAATGEPVGFAQRMESVAPPGGVMLSESTARLVERSVVLGETELVHIKGADEPVHARRLVAVGQRDGLVGHTEASLVGRRWEMAALDAIVDRAISGRGGVVNVVGPPGIGKSRMAREAAAIAAARGVEVFWTFCESHARDISFGVVARLLRASMGVADLDDGAAARARACEQVPDADPQDLLLLDDLLGIADPDLPPPQIDPDARRRRLTALINTASLARTRPALFIIEDAHWIDAVSESMIADFLTVIPRTPSMVLVTSRPEYQGALTRAPGAQAIALAPLVDSDATVLLRELLGSDPSVSALTTIIAERAAGNPFFTEEVVRELVQRGVLAGERGSHVCRTDVAELSVPPTVQAAIEARIDGLNARAKRTLNAASVIGARFGADLLVALGIDPEVEELLSAELIDQVGFTPSPEFAFHHPLIRAVAYESQLKAERAEWHRRLAAAIQEREPVAVEDNAALIAEVLRYSQTVIDLADDDPATGNLLMGSPLAVALTTRGMARSWMGLPGWRDDQRRGLTMALRADPLSLAAALPFVYFLAMPVGVLRPDDSALREIEEALRIAERSSDELVLANARMTLGVALVHRDTAAEHDKGRNLLVQVADAFVRGEHNLADLPIVEMYLARERFRRGDRDGAVPLMRAAVDDVFREGRLLVWGVAATGLLVETLLARGGDGDIAEAEAALERLEAAPVDDHVTVRDVWVLRLRALLANANGDQTANRDLVIRYRGLAESLGYEGHVDWAEAMGSRVAQ